MTKNPHAVALGSKGGKAAAQNMTPEQRIERAKKAVAAREARKVADCPFKGRMGQCKDGECIHTK